DLTAASGKYRGISLTDVKRNVALPFCSIPKPPPQNRSILSKGVFWTPGSDRRPGLATWYAVVIISGLLNRQAKEMVSTRIKKNDHYDDKCSCSAPSGQATENQASSAIFTGYCQSQGLF